MRTLSQETQNLETQERLQDLEADLVAAKGESERVRAGALKAFEKAFFGTTTFIIDTIEPN